MRAAFRYSSPPPGAGDRGIPDAWRESDATGTETEGGGALFGAGRPMFSLINTPTAISTIPQPAAIHLFDTPFSMRLLAPNDVRLRQSAETWGITVSCEMVNR